MMDMEHLYEIAAKELEVNAPRKGLYARAFSEAMGEEAKAKAIYIRLRVEQLEDTLRAQAEAHRRMEEQVRLRELSEQRKRSAASLQTSEDCKEHLSRYGYHVRDKRFIPDCWEISGGPRETRVQFVQGLDALREFTRETLLSGPSPNAEEAVGVVPAPIAGTPGSVSAATDPSDYRESMREARIARASRVGDPAPVPARFSGSARPADATMTAVASAPSGETTDPRFEKGKRWFWNVMWCALCLLAFRILFTLGSPGWGPRVAEALIGVIGAGLFLGLVAFALGWLSGGRKA